jgi:hypothetical protein
VSEETILAEYGFHRVIDEEEQVLSTVRKHHHSAIAHTLPLTRALVFAHSQTRRCRTLQRGWTTIRRCSTRTRC